MSEQSFQEITAADADMQDVMHLPRLLQQVRHRLMRVLLEERLQQLCDVFRHPYRSDTIEYQISGSIGGAMYPQDGTDYETLLDRADCALYEAKKRGKDQYVLYESHMQGGSSRKETPSDH